MPKKQSTTQASFDTIIPGISVDFDTLAVYTVDLNIYGLSNTPPVLVPASDYVLTQLNDNQFKIDFGTINQTYQIKYNATITDRSLQTYTN